MSNGIRVTKSIEESKDDEQKFGRNACTCEVIYNWNQVIAEFLHLEANLILG